MSHNVFNPPLSPAQYYTDNASDVTQRNHIRHLFVHHRKYVAVKQRSKIIGMLLLSYLR